MLEEIDAFSEPIPVFNVQGKTSVKTRAGGVVTILIATTVILYAAIKLTHMITRHAPNINDYYVDAEKDHDANLNDYNFRIAFSVED